MATLRVSNLRGRSNGQSPTLPDGAVVTGVTTTTTLAVTGVATAASSVVAGIVTTNSTGIDAGAGIITATSFSGSASGLTAVPSAQLTGALPALDGSALTNLNIPSGFSELDAALFN